MTELAPDSCIVCGKPRPAEVPSATSGVAPDCQPPENDSSWVYFAGVLPLGSMACSSDCAVVAVERFQRTGRCDVQAGTES